MGFGPRVDQVALDTGVAILSFEGKYVEGLLCHGSDSEAEKGGNDEVHVYVLVC